MPRLRVLVLLSGFVPLTFGAAYAQKLEITPARVMSDEVASIRATGLKPQQHVTVTAQLVDGGGQSWASRAEFVADANGAVDTATQKPVKGAYKVASTMGLVWSMTPASKGVNAFQAPRGDGVEHIDFQLMDGDAKIASAELEEVFRPEHIRRIELTGALQGVLFEPEAEGRYPGVLVLGGSEGGLSTGNAMWLASHGYAAVALAYFHYRNLPPKLEGIPLEYFGQAIQWMMQRPEILPDQMGVMGTSRGGELALQLGSMYPQLHAVVAFVPANVRVSSCCDHTGTAAWTWKGQTPAYVVPRNGSMQGDSNAAIQVENTHGPILVVSGEDDGVWPSSDMTKEIEWRLARAHFAYRFVRLDYPHAGHRAGHPVIIPTWTSGVKQPLSGEEMDLGGTPEGNAESSVDAIPKVLEFLQTALPGTRLRVP